MPTAWALGSVKTGTGRDRRERMVGLQYGCSGRGAVWLARLNGVQEVAGSNPVAPTLRGHSSGMMDVPFFGSFFGSRAFSPNQTRLLGKPVCPRAATCRSRSARRRLASRHRRVTQSSTHRFLHERADPCLFGGGQLLQCEGGRPHGAFVEVRLVHEAERRVPRFELLRALEEADDLAVLGICGHTVPESRREGWRAGFDDRMEPLAQGAIRFRHLGDLREHGAFSVRLVRARAAARGRLQLLDAFLHWRFPPLRLANAMCHFLSCTSPLQPLSLRRCIYSRDVQKLWQVSESCTSR